MRIKQLFIISAIIVIGGIVFAAPVRHPLTLEQKADLGATDEVVLKFSDLASATVSNTALVWTNSLGTKKIVELVAAKLITAFDTGNTNFTGACTLLVGVPSDTDAFLTSMELASDGTEIWVKAGTGTQQYVPATSTNMLVTLTPNAEEALSANTAGEIRLYLKVIDGTK